MGNDTKRNKRLAESLRNNLKKRKAQSRAKAEQNVSDVPSPSETPAHRSIEDRAITLGPDI